MSYSTLTTNNVIFYLIVLNPLKEVLCIYWIQAPNTMQMIMTFIETIISREFGLDPLSICF